ncbi:MAG: DUF4430 domain-containing protein [Firmicutes bacterium]|nr:DUF4430 domain-containing protein [Bacillota bacterium]
MIRGFHFRKSIVVMLIVLLLAAGLAGCGGAKEAAAPADEAQGSTPAAGIFAWAEESIVTADIPSAEATKDEAGKAEASAGEAAKTASASSSSAGKTTTSVSAGSAKAGAASSSGSESGSSDGETYGQGTPTPQTKALSCTLSVNCRTALDNREELAEGKTSILPSDGVILAATTVSLSEGDTVFDVLKKTLKDKGILFEFETTPLYSGVYIEGIANLYEFDCGPLSGWMYAVNGVFPNYGCGTYKLKDGDRIEWIYTCDLGRDIGGDDSAGQMGR